MYEELYRFLKQQGITEPEDCATFTQQRGCFTSDVTPWVMDFHDLAVSEARTAYDYIAQSAETIFCFPYVRHRHSNAFLERRAKYSCYLPIRSVHVAGSLLELVKVRGQKEFIVHIDFVEQLLALKPLINAGIAMVVPWRIAQYDDDISMSTMFQKAAHKKTIIEVSEIGEDTFPGVFSLPILDGVDLTRFVEVIQRNRPLFDRDADTFRRALTTGDRAEVVLSWIRSQQNNVVNIQTAFEQAAVEFRSKGIAATVGLCVTACALAIPDIPDTLQPILTTTGGAALLAGSLGWLASMRDLPTKLKDRESWLLWKSMNIKKSRKYRD